MRLAMALLLLTIGGISTTLHAQRNDGFFRAGNDDSYSNRDEVSGGISNDNFTEAPLGSGIAILLGAGLGYVALKKKEDVR